MFRVPTTLIIGAGASTELGFPTGPTFLREIADLLTFGPESDRLNGSKVARDLIHAYRQLRGKQNISINDPVYDAAARVRAASVVARSIDNVIDQNDDDPLIDVIGKLAIAYRILEAEAKSSIRAIDDSSSLFDLAGIQNTWLFPLAQMLTTDVRRSQVDTIFENLTFITFNYDRSIEAVLPSILNAAYGLEHQRAVEIASQARIYHPYGQVGTLSWDGADNSEIPYGWGPGYRLDEISRELRTFSESIQENEDVYAMRRAVQEAHTLAFLGFGFHQPNMRLLAPETDIGAQQIIASVYQEPSPAVETIQRELTRFARPLGSVPMLPMHMYNGTCFNVLNQYFLPMTASG